MRYWRGFTDKLRSPGPAVASVIHLPSRAESDTMPDWSRRRALHALATGATAALSGCNGTNRSTPAPRRSGQTPITEYSALRVRDPEADPIFWSAEDDEERRLRSRRYVTEREEISELTFAPGSEDASRLNAFVTSTEFDRQSVALYAEEIPECQQLELLSAAREEDGYHTSFCYKPRPADVACEAEAMDTVAIGIRLPFPGDEFSGGGTSWSASCHERPYPVTPSNETEVSEDA